MNAPSAANGIAAAVWYNSNTLEPTARLALPTDVCHVWAEYGLQKGLISTHSGALFTVPVLPEVSLSCWQLCNTAYLTYCWPLDYHTCYSSDGCMLHMSVQQSVQQSQGHPSFVQA